MKERNLGEALEWTFKGQITVLEWREVTQRNDSSGVEKG